jgi:hypothetical protein
MTDDPDLTLGDSDVAGPYDDLETAARAFLACEHPYKQLINIDGEGIAGFLSDREERYLERLCAVAGYTVEEVGA